MKTIAGPRYAAAWAATVAAAWGLCTGVALASGAEPEDEFVTRSEPGNTLAEYESGQLGVVLPGFDRIYLYTAWRAIVLGADAWQRAPRTPGGLERARGAYVDGWVSLTDEQHPFNQWQKASEAAVPSRTRAADNSGNIALGPGYASYINCAPAAFTFARQTLQDLGGRADATPQRVAEWVAGQRAVFAFCAYDGKARDGANAKPAPPWPAPLPAGTPTYWRQLRDYQIAAAHFYAADLPEAAKRFSIIGKAADHPMRPWGAYLALRAHLRQATLSETVVGSIEQDAAAAPLLAEAQRILDDASLAPVHDATRATVRTMQFRLIPRHRLAELSRALEDLHANPYDDDRLGDWRRVANLSIDGQSDEDKNPVEARLRRQHEFFDWIRTMQHCGAAVGAAERVAPCQKEVPRVMATWQGLAADKSAEAAGRRQAWLLAAMSLTDKLEPAVEKAALAVPPTAPEYFSVRYQLARLYRLASRPVQARDVAQAGLEEIRRQQLNSISAANLFKQERFAQATSLKDAADHLLRSTGYARAPDSGEVTASVPDGGRPADDGLTWLNTRLAVVDLLALARDERLDGSLRARMAVAAWVRADLLGTQEPAIAAATLAAQLAPSLKQAVANYRSAASPAQRRHVLVLDAMALGLSPLVTVNGWSEAAWTQPDGTPPPKADVVAGMWCSIGKNQASYWGIDNGEVEQSPPPPDASTDAAARDREMAVLSKVKTATGFVADHVLAWAQTNPGDPDLPWLLYVVVQSTRAGCLDADASKASKAAFQLLHRKYKGSEWTRKTPVWY